MSAYSDMTDNELLTEFVDLCYDVRDNKYRSEYGKSIVLAYYEAQEEILRRMQKVKDVHQTLQEC